MVNHRQGWGEPHEANSAIFASTTKVVLCGATSQSATGADSSTFLKEVAAPAESMRNVAEISTPKIHVVQFHALLLELMHFSIVGTVELRNRDHSKPRRIAL